MDCLGQLVHATGANEGGYLLSTDRRRGLMLVGLTIAGIGGVLVLIALIAHGVWIRIGEAKVSEAAVSVPVHE